VRLRQKQTERVLAGKEYRVTCETAGSKPPATLRWIKGGKEITQVSTQVSPVSFVMFIIGFWAELPAAAARVIPQENHHGPIKLNSLEFTLEMLGLKGIGILTMFEPTPKSMFHVSSIVTTELRLYYVRAICVA